VQANVLLSGIGEQIDNIKSEREQQRLHKVDLEQQINYVKEHMRQEEILQEGLDPMMRMYV
jgi:hypothetical protein